MPITEQPDCNNFISEEGQEFSICRNINYTKIKLYVLSILWRASISSRPFFELIKLDEGIENEIRNMILNNTPGSYHEFPILVFSWLNDNTARKDVILQPKKYIENKGFRYCFPIRGIVFNIYTNWDDVPMNLDDFLLNDKTLPMLHFPKGDYLNYIKKYNGF